MRTLTKKQKKLIDKWIESNDIRQQFNSYEQLPPELRDELEVINDTEILWSETQRYISDTVGDKLYL